MRENRVGRRRRLTILVLGALAGTMVILLVVFSVSDTNGNQDQTSGDSPDEVQSQAPADTDDQDPPASPPPPLDIDRADPGPLEDESDELERVTRAVETVVDVTTQIAHRADGQIDGLDGIATGFVLGEMQAMSVEYEHLGLTQTGAAEIVSVALISSELDSEPATMSLSVCLDVSGIDVLDAAGNSQADLLYDPDHPVQHIYGAEFLDEVWKLSTHEIPDDSDCPEPEGS